MMEAKNYRERGQREVDDEEQKRARLTKRMESKSEQNGEREGKKASHHSTPNV